MAPVIVIVTEQVFPEVALPQGERLPWSLSLLQ
jgi:hypothetical protein